MHPTPLRIFGYGSLVASPERADRLQSWSLATLSGWSRAFDKRSPTRGCPRSDAWAAFPIAPGFLVDGVVYSLVVSISDSPGARITGAVLEWAAPMASAVLAQTDRREGYDERADRAEQGYLRVPVDVEVDGDSLRAWTYRSNEGGAWDARMDLGERARQLINATPRPDSPSGRDGRARGIGYLELIRNALYARGRVDSDLEAQAAAILDHAGPWCAQCAPPRPA